MSLLRVVVCGAVDDGKSTLIGRLLAETGSVPSDEVLSVTDANGVIDYSRLTDGLESEREQGITIDVAYRYLRLPFGARALLADSPGHEQYTRNMAVAASMASTAILVVDAVRGVREQTLRHANVCRLMGVNSFVIALNKVDALGPSRAERLLECNEQLSALLRGALNDATVQVIEVSGITGENVTEGEHSLMNALSTSIQFDSATESAVRLPVQRVVVESGRRWYTGRLASGTLGIGDEIAVWPSAATARILGIWNAGQPAERASAGQSISVELDCERDIGRGDVLVRATDLADLPVSRAHLAELVWLHDQPLDFGMSYLLRVGPIEVPARIDTVRFVRDLDTSAELAAPTFQRNDLGRVELSTDQPILLDSYEFNRSTGGFILSDRRTGETVAAGMAVQPLQRDSEVSRHQFTVTRQLREQLNGVRASVIWLTGLPGSGKSTIADAVDAELFQRGIRSYVLDGDTVRQTLSSDLGFAPEDRTENVRRVARVAQLMMDAGLVVLVSLVSPIRADRDAARELFAGEDFVEVWVDTPLAVCQDRDPKGLYNRAGKVGGGTMTGMGQPYEQPLNAEIQIDGTQDVTTSASQIVELITARRLAL